MLFSPEFVTLPVDWNMLLVGAGIAGAAGLATVLASDSQDEDHEGPESIDLDILKGRVDELENTSSRTLEQNDELAALYAVWAEVLCGSGAELDEITDKFGKAETVLNGKGMIPKPADNSAASIWLGQSLFMSTKSWKKPSTTT